MLLLIILIIILAPILALFGMTCLALVFGFIAFIYESTIDLICRIFKI